MLMSGRPRNNAALKKRVEEMEMFWGSGRKELGGESRREVAVYRMHRTRGAREERPREGVLSGMEVGEGPSSEQKPREKGSFEARGTKALAGKKAEGMTAVPGT
jgi:hypothetical protein